MIQVATYPADLSQWKQDIDPFYLEVFGEAEPMLDMDYAETVPAGGHDAQTSQATPIYEYWWTIGHGGHGPVHRHLFDGRKKDQLWGKLDDVAARVYLYFPISGGWRAKELVATVKYLSPVSDQKNWTAKAAADWQKAEPLLAGAGQVASSLGAVVPIAAGAAPVLSALSKLQIGSVPQGVKGFNWYVEKVTFGPGADHGVMQGVVWALPKPMFELLGGRLTGSLALSFIPSQSQSRAGEIWTPEALPMLAHAVVYAAGKEQWVPAKNKFVELKLTPVDTTPAT
jgi:hypothetical protein